TPGPRSGIPLSSGAGMGDVKDSPKAKESRAPKRRRKLGEVLLEAGLLTQDQLTKALEECARSGQRLGEHLVDQTIVSERDIAWRSAVKEAAEKIYQKKEVVAAVDRIVADSTEEFSADLLEVLAAESQPTESEIHSLEEATRQAPIVRLCNMLMTEAVRSRVSDIHVEPTKKDTIVRLRVDGLLRETMRLPKAVHASIVSRFKVLAKMDIAERRAPQDGAIRVKIEQREVDLRVSSLPILHGEKMVLRVTDQSKSLPKLQAIGLSEKDYATITSFIQRHT